MQNGYQPKRKGIFKQPPNAGSGVQPPHFRKGTPPPPPIKKEKQKLRPCYVNEKKALFHRWEERSDIVAPSPMAGGHGGGALKYTLAIVEYEDGTIDEVRPRQIRFADDKINEYAF